MKVNMDEDIKVRWWQWHDAHQLASIHIVVDLGHGAAWGCPYSAVKNCSRLPRCLLKTHPPPSLSNSLGKPNRWVFSVYKSSYPCQQNRTMCCSQWMHGLQTAVIAQCLCRWYWLLGQYRQTSPCLWRDDHVDHSAMSSRIATLICPCHYWWP